MPTLTVQLLYKVKVGFYCCISPSPSPPLNLSQKKNAFIHFQIDTKKQKKIKIGCLIHEKHNNIDYLDFSLEQPLCISSQKPSTSLSNFNIFNLYIKHFMMRAFIFTSANLYNDLLSTRANPSSSSQQCFNFGKFIVGFYG